MIGLTRLSCLILVLTASSGCVSDRWHLLPSGDEPAPQGGSMVLHGDRLEPVLSPTEGTAAADLANAHELFRQGEYGKAERAFRRLANNTKNSEVLAEEARFYEAECLRLQERFPKAADTYTRQLKDFPSGAHREEAVRHQLQIAHFWLEDTREEIRLQDEKQKGVRKWVWPAAIIHFEKQKPFMDEEGRAKELLEHVSSNDFGQLADEALFLDGLVTFYRQDYREADHYFSQLIERHPNSPYAARAVKLAIISKHMSTGGSEYDGRQVAEALQLVQVARNTYPELAKDKDFLDRQEAGIRKQQAEKDFNTAELFRRTGHPGGAYFYYDIVCRRYPGTPLADKAAKRMKDLEAKAKKAAPPVNGTMPLVPVTSGNGMNQPGTTPEALPPALGPTLAPAAPPAPPSGLSPVR